MYEISQWQGCSCCDKEDAALCFGHETGVSVKISGNLGSDLTSGVIPAPCHSYDGLHFWPVKVLEPTAVRGCKRAARAGVNPVQNANEGTWL